MVEMDSKCLFKYPCKHLNDIWTICLRNATFHHVCRTVIRFERFIFPRFESIPLQPMKYSMVIFGIETIWHLIPYVCHG